MKRFGMFLLVLIGFALVAALYVIQTRTKSAGKEVRRLEQALENEEAAIAVLNAEIAHLESPKRLSGLAVTHLGLEPSSPEQIVTLDDVIVRVPLRNPDAQIAPDGASQ